MTVKPLMIASVCLTSTKTLRMCEVKSPCHRFWLDNGLVTTLLSLIKSIIYNCITEFPICNASQITKHKAAFPTSSWVTVRLRGCFRHDESRSKILARRLRKPECGSGQLKWHWRNILEDQVHLPPGNVHLFQPPVLATLWDYRLYGPHRLDRWAWQFFVSSLV